MRPMTRHKHAHTGLVTPQLPQLLLTAVLRMLAMLVLNVASTFQMKQLHPKRDWHTPDDEAALPRVKIDTLKQQHAVQQDSPIALMLRSAAKLRVSKHEGVLTVVSHKLQLREHPIPLAPPSLRVRRFASNPRRKSGPRSSRVICVAGLLTQPWIPACAGTSGLFSPPNKNAAA